DRGGWTVGFGRRLAGTTCFGEVSARGGPSRPPPSGLLARSMHERVFHVLRSPPHPVPLPLRGRGDRNGSLSLGEGEGRGEGADLFTHNPRQRAPSARARSASTAHAMPVWMVTVPIPTRRHVTPRRPTLPIRRASPAG